MKSCLFCKRTLYQYIYNINEKYQKKVLPINDIKRLFSRLDKNLLIERYICHDCLYVLRVIGSFKKNLHNSLKSEDTERCQVMVLEGFRIFKEQISSYSYKYDNDSPVNVIEHEPVEFAPQDDEPCSDEDEFLKPMYTVDYIERGPTPTSKEVAAINTKRGRGRPRQTKSSQNIPTDKTFKPRTKSATIYTRRNLNVKKQRSKSQSSDTKDTEIVKKEEIEEINRLKPTYCCHIDCCLSRYKDFKDIQAHIIFDHKLDQLLIQEEYDKRVKDFWKSKYRFKNGPIEEYKYPCLINYCHQFYKKFDELNDHKIEAHKQLATFHCPECNVRMTSEEDFHNHSKLKHKRNLTNCILCSSILENTADLQKHLRIHQNRNFICMHCRETFLNNDALEEHQKIHTERKTILDHYDSLKHPNNVPKVIQEPIKRVVHIRVQKATTNKAQLVSPSILPPKFFTNFKILQRETYNINEDLSKVIPKDLKVNLDSKYVSEWYKRREQLLGKKIEIGVDYANLHEKHFINTALQSTKKIDEIGLKFKTNTMKTDDVDVPNGSEAQLLDTTDNILVQSPTLPILDKEPSTKSKAEIKLEKESMNISDIVENTLEGSPKEDSRIENQSETSTLLILNSAPKQKVKIVENKLIVRSVDGSKKRETDSLNKESTKTSSNEFEKGKSKTLKLDIKHDESKHLLEKKSEEKTMKISEESKSNIIIVDSLKEQPGKVGDKQFQIKMKEIDDSGTENQSESLINEKVKKNEKNTNISEENKSSNIMKTESLEMQLNKITFKEYQSDVKEKECSNPPKVRLEIVEKMSEEKGINISEDNNGGNVIKIDSLNKQTEVKKNEFSRNETQSNMLFSNLNTLPKESLQMNENKLEEKSNISKENKCFNVIKTDSLNIQLANKHTEVKEKEYSRKKNKSDMPYSNLDTLPKESLQMVENKSEKKGINISEENKGGSVIDTDSLNIQPANKQTEVKEKEDFGKEIQSDILFSNLDTLPKETLQIIKNKSEEKCINVAEEDKSIQTIVVEVNKTPAERVWSKSTNTKLNEPKIPSTTLESKSSEDNIDKNTRIDKEVLTIKTKGAKKYFHTNVQTKSSIFDLKLTNSENVTTECTPSVGFKVPNIPVNVSSVENISLIQNKVGDKEVASRSKMNMSTSEYIDPKTSRIDINKPIPKNMSSEDKQMLFETFIHSCSENSTSSYSKPSSSMFSDTKKINKSKISQEIKLPITEKTNEEIDLTLVTFNKMEAETIPEKDNIKKSTSDILINPVITDKTPVKSNVKLDKSSSKDDIHIPAINRSVASDNRKIITIKHEFQESTKLAIDKTKTTLNIADKDIKKISTAFKNVKRAGASLTRPRNVGIESTTETDCRTVITGQDNKNVDTHITSSDDRNTIATNRSAEIIADNIGAIDSKFVTQNENDTCMSGEISDTTNISTIVHEKVNKKDNIKKGIDDIIVSNTSEIILNTKDTSHKTAGKDKKKNIIHKSGGLGIKKTNTDVATKSSMSQEDAELFTNTANIKAGKITGKDNIKPDIMDTIAETDIKSLTFKAAKENDKTSEKNIGKAAVKKIKTKAQKSVSKNLNIETAKNKIGIGRTNKKNKIDLSTECGTSTDAIISKSIDSTVPIKFEETESEKNTGKDTVAAAYNTKKVGAKDNIKPHIDKITAKDNKKDAADKTLMKINKKITTKAQSSDKFTTELNTISDNKTNVGVSINTSKTIESSKKVPHQVTLKDNTKKESDTISTDTRKVVADKTVPIVIIERSPIGIIKSDVVNIEKTGVKGRKKVITDVSIGSATSKEDADVIMPKLIDIDKTSTKNDIELMQTLPKDIVIVPVKSKGTKATKNKNKTFPEGGSIEIITTSKTKSKNITEAIRRTSIHNIKTSTTIGETPVDDSKINMDEFLKNSVIRNHQLSITLVDKTGLRTKNESMYNNISMSSSKDKKDDDTIVQFDDSADINLPVGRRRRNSTVKSPTRKRKSIEIQTGKSETITEPPTSLSISEVYPNISNLASFDVTIDKISNPLVNQVTDEPIIESSIKENAKIPIKTMSSVSSPSTIIELDKTNLSLVSTPKSRHRKMAEICTNPVSKLKRSPTKIKRLESTFSNIRSRIELKNQKQDKVRVKGLLKNNKIEENKLKNKLLELQKHELDIAKLTDIDTIQTTSKDIETKQLGGNKKNTLKGKRKKVVQTSKKTSIDSCAEFDYQEVPDVGVEIDVISSPKFDRLLQVPEPAIEINPLPPPMLKRKRGRPKKKAESAISDLKDVEINNYEEEPPIDEEPNIIDDVPETFSKTKRRRLGNTSNVIKAGNKKRKKSQK